eukprot:TCALIF_02295-PA protein Name:"Protein of unknown function" AED:0.75 eAED:1.00 QI:0/0/0/0.5/0/0.5/2/0/157
MMYPTGSVGLSSYRIVGQTFPDPVWEERHLASHRIGPLPVTRCPPALARLSSPSCPLSMSDPKPEGSAAPPSKEEENPKKEEEAPVHTIADDSDDEEAALVRSMVGAGFEVHGTSTVPPSPFIPRSRPHPSCPSHDKLDLWIEGYSGGRILNLADEI